jgi:hypothetical protein
MFRMMKIRPRSQPRLKEGWAWELLPERNYTMSTTKIDRLPNAKNLAKVKLQQFKNKLNGLKYFKMNSRIKYIDGVKYVLCLQVNGGQNWIKEDILEFEKFIEID